MSNVLWWNGWTGPTLGVTPMTSIQSGSSTLKQCLRSYQRHTLLSGGCHRSRGTDGRFTTAVCWTLAVSVLVLPECAHVWDRDAFSHSLSSLRPNKAAVLIVLVLLAHLLQWEWGSISLATLHNLLSLDCLSCDKFKWGRFCAAHFVLTIFFVLQPALIT